ncbi:AMP-binding protein [Acetatifactor muris]|uniref:Long-chain-fatty-acid--CoA ligase n=1 Tax=Acetatifactor muris TaxID=879566 RepID=A0A2K4ZA70_9FIRM|nr:AMP-binding protein [Acetatifactor muris]MCR2047469.1 AMP-binding protein [Acetatifactor muris]SOY27364.1 Long-chain-fatty-acid--CoA ligase [Acetatifactor muris]
MWNFGKYQNKTAIVDENGISVTYRQLQEEGYKIGNVISRRCLVFCLCTNTIGSITGYTSFVENKITPVLLNAYLDRELLNNLLDNYLPSYLWIPTKLVKEFQQMQSVYSAYGYTLLKTGYIKSNDLFDDLCLMLTTSGSTGSPKFVRQSYSNVLSNAESIAQYLELDETERPITTLPMNYTYGLSIINSHLLVGATILVTEKGLMQKEFWTFFKDNEATSFGGVPYTYEILERLRFYRMKLPSLRYMTQAGGKLIPELHAKFAEYAAANEKKFIVMYGQCEATARMGYLPADKAVEKCGSMGIAIPGGNFKLIDADGNNITEPFVTGELVYEGPNVTLGYAECGDDLIKGDERNGALQTGDMAQFDTDGYYFIVGRKKRFLKIYGNRVNLDEMDRLIKGKFNGIDCASTGVDDHMYIFVTDEGLADQVRDFVVFKTRLNPSAFKTIVIDEIPKNDSGKILYKELTKYYELQRQERNNL